MRVFVAGATGAIGKQLVPRLVAAGHEVHGMTRSESKQAMRRVAGDGSRSLARRKALTKKTARPVVPERWPTPGPGWGRQRAGSCQAAVDEGAASTAPARPLTLERLRRDQTMITANAAAISEAGGA